MSAPTFFPTRVTTTRIASAAVALSVLAVATLGAACGSEDDPNKFTGLRDGSTIGKDDSGINFNLGGDSNTPPSDGGNGCNTAFKPAAPPPLHLVILLDYSGSMITASNNVTSSTGASITRFDAVKQAWIEYAKLPQANPVSATLVPFGLSSKTATDDVCSEASYVPFLLDTSMPNEAAVTAAIASKTPQGSNETPTAGGVFSGLKAARALKLQFPKDDVAIVLSTDGAPSMCGTLNVPAMGDGTPGADGNISHVNAAKVAEIAALGEGFKTYVVGVGTQWATTLNELAAAGGTVSATNITSTSANAIAQQLKDKLTSVSREFQCKLPLTADALANLADTNVLYEESAAAAEITLVYAQGCPASETRAAYQYDNATNPTSVILCATQCNAFTSAPDAEVTLAVGCTPRVQ